MRIKKFNELFDTEDLKSKHEIDYLRGDFKKIIGTKELDLKNENIYHLISKMSRFNLPFMSAFMTDDLENVVEGMSLKITKSPEDDYYVFGAEDDYNLVAIGIAPNSPKYGRYKMFVFAEDKSELEDPTVYEYEDLSYQELIEYMKELYIPALYDFQLGQLVEFNKGHNIDLEN